MSTTAIIRINVQDGEGKTCTVRLRQYADGYGDFVYEKLDVSLEEARNMAILEDGVEMFAHSLAATYEAHANENLPSYSKGITKLSDLETNKAFGGDYKYVVNVVIDAFTDTVVWRVTGPREYF